MKRCSEFAYAMCPYRHICGPQQDAVYMEGTDCAAFNRSVEDLPMTNADRIRAMSDVELAVFLSDDDRACPPKHPNCHKYVNNCAGCYLEWLQQPAEVPV